MPAVLIADDDANLRGTLGAALREEGFDVIEVANGLEVLEFVDEAKKTNTPLPETIVLDCLLPKKQGFDVAAGLRARNVTSSIVFISGIFKSKAHHEDGKKLGAVGFLNKPFPITDLITLVEQSSHVTKGPAQEAAPKAPMPAEGALVENPVLHLLWRAGREQQTGILDVFGPKRGRVFVFKGRITMAQAGAANINLGVELIRLGVLTGKMYDQLIQIAVEKRRGLYALIKDEDWVDSETIKAAYRRLIPRAVGFVIAAGGRFRWTDSSEFKRFVPAAPTSVKSTIDAALRSARKADLDAHVTPRGTFRLAPGPNFDAIAPRLVSACGSDSLIRSINGRATIAQMLAAARNEGDKVERMRQAYMLMSTQAVIASTEVIQMDAAATAARAQAAAAAPQPAPRAVQQPAAPRPQPAAVPKPVAAPQPVAAQAPRPVAAQPARPKPPVQPSPETGPVEVAPGDSTPSASTEGAPVTDLNAGGSELRLAKTKAVVAAAKKGPAATRPEDKAARKKVLDKLAALHGKNHYEVLGVAPEADAGTIKKAYFALAREFHTDAFAGNDLGQTADALDSLFAIIQDANAVLSNDKKRGNFDAALSMDQQGMSTDIAALMEAENTFAKAKTLVNRGEMPGAVKLLEECLAVSPGNEEWGAYRDYAQWWITRDKMRAKMLIASLGDLGKKLQGIPDISYFAGAIALEVGDTTRARSLLKRVIGMDARHGKANSALRRLNKAEADDGKKKSGLGRFLKR